MVAFYLQNTKKILVSLLLFVWLTSFKCSDLPKEESNCRKISSYLELELRFDRDTVAVGETVMLEAVFKNKTDTALQFYPKALLYIAQPSSGFETKTYPINDTLYLTNIANIASQGIYSNTYNLKISESFFKKGLNQLRLIYLCSELKGDSKIYNKLCGSLESHEIKLIVIP